MRMHGNRRLRCCIRGVVEQQQRNALRRGCPDLDLQRGRFIIRKVAPVCLALSMKDHAELARVAEQRIQRAKALHTRRILDHAGRHRGNLKLALERGGYCRGCDVGRQLVKRIARQLWKAHQLVGRERSTERGQRNGCAAGQAGVSDLQTCRWACVQRKAPTALRILRLHRDRRRIDPVSLQLIERPGEQLRGRWLLRINGRVPGNHPAFQLLRNLQGLVRPGVLHTRNAVMNDEAKMPRRDTHIKIRTIAVITRVSVVRGAEAPVWIGGRAIHIQQPVVVISVGPVIVNARMIRRDRRVLAVAGQHWLIGKKRVAAGNLPELPALRRRVDILVRPRILRISLVKNQADILSSRRHTHIEVSPKTIRARDRNRTTLKVIGLGRVEKGINRPPGVVPIRAEVMHTNVSRRDRWIALRKGRAAKNPGDSKQDQQGEAAGDEQVIHVDLAPAWSTGSRWKTQTGAKRKVFEQKCYEVSERGALAGQGAPLQLEDKTRGKLDLTSGVLPRSGYFPEVRIAHIAVWTRELRSVQGVESISVQFQRKPFRKVQVLL